MLSFRCPTCEECYGDEKDRDDHMVFFEHWPECETCPKVFRTLAARDQHMNATGHWAPEFECETCPKRFLTERTADQHMMAFGHYRNYCPTCDRHFTNENNLRMHLNSRTHRGSTISCPFCTAAYTTASGLSHHLERGACPKAPRLNRETIHRMIRERDPHGTITNKLIEWHGEANSTFFASDWAFNGRSWECYMCHRGFKSRRALNQHLNSPFHQQNIYHCPNLRGRCKKQFSTLAALFNHLESESCRFMRFEKVQQQMSDVINGNRMIAF